MFDSPQNISVREATLVSLHLIYYYILRHSVRISPILSYSMNTKKNSSNYLELSEIMTIFALVNR